MIKDVIRLFQVIQNIKLELFVFYCSIIFYGILWVLSPSNKLILVFSLLLYICIYLRSKNHAFSLVTCYLILSIIQTGKRYDFIIIPPGIFSIDFYPLGYYVSAIITPSFFPAFFMAFILFREILHRTIPIRSINVIDILFILGYLSQLTSDLFVSSITDIAIILWIMSLPLFFVYFFVRLMKMDHKILLYCAMYIFASLVIIESFIAVSQYIVGGPVGKSIESVSGVELFGEAADEYTYRFRPVGTYDHANILGAFIVIFIPIILFIINKSSNAFFYISIFVGILTLGLTLSRSAWIGLCTGIFFQLTFVKKIIVKMYYSLHLVSKIFLIVISLITIVIVIAPRLYASFFSLSDSGGAYTRSIQMNIAMRLIMQTPFFGVGTALFVPKGLEIDTTGLLHYFPSPVHNRYMLQASENGIISVVLYGLFMILSCVLLYRATNKQSSREIEQISTVYTSCVAAVLVIGFFQPYKLEWGIVILFALIYSYVISR